MSNFKKEILIYLSRLDDRDQKRILAQIKAFSESDYYIFSILHNEFKK